MSTQREHFVIIIPGLGDDKPVARFIIRTLTNHWKNHFTLRIYRVTWLNDEDFQPKLARTLDLIDELSKKGTVSIVGTSAGASMALNAFAKRKAVIHRAVNVCGRLREGKHVVRSLDKMAKTSKSFKQSVLAFEKIEPSLTSSDRQRILTLRPLFGDELVPRDTAFLKGAVNRWVYTPEHMFSIGFSLFFSKPILSFLRETHS